MDIILDLETRSALDLKQVSAGRYAAHPSTSLLCIAWQIVGESEIHSWAPGDNDETAADRLHWLVADGANVHAWNSPFDAAVWNAQPSWPAIKLEQQHDIAARAAMCGLPRGLEKCAAALGLANSKHKDGKNALRYLMRPRKWSACGAPVFAEDAARLALVRIYNEQDIRLEAQLHAKLPALPDSEREIWLHDQRLNERGFRIDPQFLAVAGPFLVKAQQAGDAEMRRITGGAVGSVAAVKALGQWLQAQGVDLRVAGDNEDVDEDDEDAGGDSGKGQLTKAAVRALLERPGLPAAARAALEVRQDYGRSSVAKIVALAGAVSPDSRLRGSLLYHGTLTGRQSGRIFQPQNLPRDSYPAGLWPAVLADMRTLDATAFRSKHGSPMAALVRLLRGTIVPADGSDLVAGDFATVELRVLAWLAGQTDLVDALASGAKLYEAMAASVFQVPVDEIGKNDERRTLGKIGVLSCGYGAGWKSLIKISRDAYQLAVDEPLARAAVDAYRTGYPKVPLLWRELEEAAFDALAAPGVAFPVCAGRAALKATRYLQWLGLQLPSGRWVRMHQPKIILDDRNGLFDPRETLSCMGLNVAHQWVRQTLWGGVLTAYLVQSTARDLLVAAALRCEARGWPVVLQVHDEVVVETPAGSVTADMLAEECRARRHGQPAARSRRTAQYAIAMGRSRSHGRRKQISPLPGFRADNSGTWVSLNRAAAIAERYPPGHVGIAFATVAGMIGFNLDNCIGPNGPVTPWIDALIEQLNSFTYTLHGGAGMRVVCSNSTTNPIAAGKHTVRTPSGHKFEVFVGPCGFLNEFHNPATNGKPVAERAQTVRKLFASNPYQRERE